MCADLGYRVTVMLDDPAYPDHLQPNCFNIVRLLRESPFQSHALQLREMLNLVHDARPGDKLFFGCASCSHCPACKLTH